MHPRLEANVLRRHKAAAFRWGRRAVIYAASLLALMAVLAAASH